MSEIKLIPAKTEGEWYWKKGNAKRVGPFRSEYEATKDARRVNGHDERQNYPRREETAQ